MTGPLTGKPQKMSMTNELIDDESSGSLKLHRDEDSDPSLNLHKDEESMDYEIDDI